AVRNQYGDEVVAVAQWIAPSQRLLQHAAVDLERGRYGEDPLQPVGKGDIGVRRHRRPEHRTRMRAAYAPDCELNATDAWRVGTAPFQLWPHDGDAFADQVRA